MVSLPLHVSIVLSALNGVFSYCIADLNHPGIIQVMSGEKLPPPPISFVTKMCFMNQDTYNLSVPLTKFETS